MSESPAWNANGVLPGGTCVFHRAAPDGTAIVRFVDLDGQQTEYHLVWEGRSVTRFVDGVEVPLPAERAAALFDACTQRSSDCDEAEGASRGVAVVSAGVVAW